MNIVKGFPPNYDELKRHLPIEGVKGVIFTYGDTVFVPSGQELSPELKAHEQVHCDRQIVPGPEKWWEMYIADPQFRLAEELLAHQMEYHVFCRLHKDRNERAKALKHMARRLAGPMYDYIITEYEATVKIRRGNAHSTAR